MTILTVDKKKLEKIVGKITPELENKITEMGTPIEEVTDDELSVEVFPNRPDLLSLENFARAINQFMGKRGLVNFKVNKPEKDYIVTINKAVKEVRPFTACAVIKGLKFSDARIKSVIELQEKLHGSYGRNRRKLALGIYPIEEIIFPLTYTAEKPNDIKFQPLEFPRVITGRQILSQHPTGRDYGELLKGQELFPIYKDAAGEIMSMPPIINSHKTGRITEKTKAVFIECSGFNKEYLKKTIDLVVSSFSEMGGKIYAVEIKDNADGNFITPDMAPEKMKFKIKDIEKTLGIELTEKNVKNYLSRMGIGYENDKGKSVAIIPCYRTDILHWIDLAEEVAIAYGYENFVPEIPDISTIAYEDPMDVAKKTIGNVLAGLGLLETSSFHLVTKKNVKKMHYDFNDFIELEDSKTERDVLRIDMLTNLLQIASENSNAAYPQKTFEMGRIFSRSVNENSETGIDEKERLAISLIDEKINFTELKQVLDYLFKMLNIEYLIENVENNNYIIGRCGKIIVDGKDIGFIGEVAPRVLKNWKIKLPMVALEIGLDFLGTC
ncbi:phenylalanine--tRNA ligase subunit beta [Candidatus Pacearchaeota archaeon]|nr:phenylalanine--tRNA ligase subunit beta [Candidatus Pacearchaeota archaeon]